MVLIIIVDSRPSIDFKYSCLQRWNPVIHQHNILVECGLQQGEALPSEFYVLLELLLSPLVKLF